MCASMTRYHICASMKGKVISVPHDKISYLCLNDRRGHICASMTGEVISVPQ